MTPLVLRKHSVIDSGDRGVTASEPENSRPLEKTQFYLLHLHLGDLIRNSSRFLKSEN